MAIPGGMGIGIGGKPYAGIMPGGKACIARQGQSTQTHTACVHGAKFGAHQAHTARCTCMDSDF